MIMHLFASFFFVVAFISSVEAQATLPNLTLPWGTWQATKYDKKGDVRDTLVEECQQKEIVDADSSY